MKRVLALLWVYLAVASQAMAATTYYVDPDWGGTASGGASTPWVSLNAGAWTTINSALAADDVVVYFSARDAGADSNETTTTDIGLNRTDGSAHRLTLDGRSRYNTNNGAPAWEEYGGSARFQVTASIPLYTPNSAQNNITIRGFRLIATGGQVVFWWGGNNFIFEQNELSSSVTNTNGPAFYYGYTKEEGTTCPTTNAANSCTAFDGITIRQNYIHDTFGEGIYVGGCADNSGCLSHTNVTVEDNIVGTNIAGYGGQADAIDLKDGLRTVIVRGNVVQLQKESRAGISTESGAVIERNHIISAGWAGVALSAFWNNSGATRAGTIVRNNIIVHTGGNSVDGFGSRYGIYLDEDATGDAYSDAVIANNTIWSVTNDGGTIGVGIYAGASGTTVKNNLVASCAEQELYALSGALTAHSNNLFYDATGGATLVTYGASNYTSATLASFEATGLSGNPAFASTSSPYAAEQFRLTPGSPAINAGTTVTGYSVDYFGVTHTATWEIGAVEYSTAAPAAPTAIAVVMATVPVAQWTHAGTDVGRFEIVIDGTWTTDAKQPTPSSQTYQYDLPTLTAGSHTLVVKACNSVGCASSSALTVVKL